MRKKSTLDGFIKKFNSRYLKNERTGCWEWARYRDKDGYGVFLSNVGSYAHRFSYYAFVGQLNSELVIDHLCNNACCVNPEHLRQVTQRTNVLMGIGVTAQNALKTNCPKGHSYSIYGKKRKDKGRRCTLCDSQYHELRKQKEGKYWLLRNKF